MTFQSHYFAIKADKSLKEHLPFCLRLSPTPRQVSSSCSSCLIAKDVAESLLSAEVLSLLKSAEGLEGLYYFTEDKKKKVLYERE